MLRGVRAAYEERVCVRELLREARQRGGSGEEEEGAKKRLAESREPTVKGEKNNNEAENTLLSTIAGARKKGLETWTEPYSDLRRLRADCLSNL